MDGLELKMQKKAAREKYTAILAALSPRELALAGAHMCAALCQSELWTRAQSIFCFYGTAREPDTVPILEQALASGKTLYLPRCIPGKPGEMEAVQVQSLTQLSTGFYGLKEPTGTRTAEPETIHLALLPCVAATPEGLRLGHGGGYYDRFLARFGGTSVVLCHSAAVAQTLPRGAYDRRADWLLTEQALYPAKQISAE